MLLLLFMCRNVSFTATATTTSVIQRRVQVQRIQQRPLQEQLRQCSSRSFWLQSLQRQRYICKTTTTIRRRRRRVSNSSVQDQNRDERNTKKTTMMEANQIQVIQFPFSFESSSLSLSQQSPEQQQQPQAVGAVGAVNNDGTKNLTTTNVEFVNTTTTTPLYNDRNIGRVVIWCNNDNNNDDDVDVSNATKAAGRNDGRWIQQQQQQQRNYQRYNMKQLPAVQHGIRNVIQKYLLPISIQQLQSPGYIHYAYYTFLANIAGSASLILSTQILLSTIMVNSTITGGDAPFASTTTTASDLPTTTAAVVASSASSSSSSTATAITAGAMNWMIKDGIGQMGGIIVTSYMGQKYAYDTHPKYYRVVAAMLLDFAALIEISTPIFLSTILLHSSSSSSSSSSSIYIPNTSSTSIYVVLALAGVSTICKNIGYIMISACRATIHQSLCIPNIEQLQQQQRSSTTATTTTTTAASAASAAAAGTEQQRISTTTVAATTGNNPSTNNNNNLADVTAKFASQSTVAGLFGTMIGIAFTSSGTTVLPWIQEHITTTSIIQPPPPAQLLYYYYLTGFVGMVSIHQSCNYLSLRHVSLYHLNRHRLCIICEHYVSSLSLEQQQQHRSLDDQGTSTDESPNDPTLNHTTTANYPIPTSNVLTPQQVAEREHYFPNPFRWWHREKYNTNWLLIGCSLPTICPNGSQQLIQLLNVCPNEQYIINVENETTICRLSRSNRRIQLVFLQSATSDDLIRGMLHAHLLKNQMRMNLRSDDSIENMVPKSNNYNDNTMNDIVLRMIQNSHQILQSSYEPFVQQLHSLGWNTNTVHIEDGNNSLRFAIQKQQQQQQKNRSSS